MSDKSQLQLALEARLTALLPYLGDAAFSKLERTRSKNPADAKWLLSIKVAGRKTKLVVKSKVAARDLVKNENKIVVISSSVSEVWIGFQPNVEALLTELRASPLWVPRVRKAVERTLAELSGGDNADTADH